jgi:phosphohistidine phosphatase
MKRLLLIRHAKAIHESGYTDFERPLKQSGLQDAATMAARLHEYSIIPQLLISSPALRTIATANVFSEHLSLPQVNTDKEIYEADTGTLVNIIKSLPAAYDFIGLVGHNPGISQLLFYLTGEIRDMETCTTVLIDFWVEDWEAVTNDSASIAYYSYPGE